MACECDRHECEISDNLGSSFWETSAISGWYLPCKVVADRCLAALLLILLAPVLFVVMALVKLTSRGPVVYSQLRVGLHGRTFVIYKVRTMVHDCERESGACWATPDDPRITPVGRWLRRTHLDELPQLWNVFRGEMSLVGPRPERPEFVGKLEREMPHYRHRLVVRPGLTGLAQVQLPPDSGVESVRRKLAFDLYYIRELSFWLDLKLLACTAGFLGGIPFAASCKCLRVPDETTAEDTYQSLTAEHEIIPQIQTV